MIQCKKCGKMVKEGPPYCNWCGNLLYGSPGISPVPEAAPASYQNAGGDVCGGRSCPEPFVPKVPPALSPDTGKDARTTISCPEPAVPEATASSLAAEGNACAKLGKYDDALALYEQALAMEPDNHKAWHNKGIVLKRLGDLKGSQECLAYARILKETPVVNGGPLPPGPASPPVVNGRSPGATPCTGCGKTVPEGSLFCPSCGIRREWGNNGGISGKGVTIPGNNEAIPGNNEAIPGKNEAIPGKNPRYAAVFSLLIPGLGQVYNGDTIRAILVLLGTIAGTFLLFIPGIIVWIYGIVNAYRSAKRINAGQARVRARSDLFMILYVVVAVILVAAVFIIVSAVIAAFALGASATTAGSG